MEPIVFELRDIDADVVKAWEKYFKGIASVRISHGDIFEKPADAIVSPANSFGYMDGGIDLVYLRRFGWELQTRRTSGMTTTANCQWGRRQLSRRSTQPFPI
jgi:hypothetical protein